MSKFTALSKGFESASRGMQGSSTYQGVVANANKQVNISLSYGQIGIIFALSIFT
jgi:hypothetical protein